MSDSFVCDAVSCVHWSENGKLVAVGFTNGHLRVLDVQSKVFESSGLCPGARLGSPIQSIVELGDVDHPFFVGFGALGGLIAASAEADAELARFRVIVEAVAGYVNELDPQSRATYGANLEQGLAAVRNRGIVDSLTVGEAVLTAGAVATLDRAANRIVLAGMGLPCATATLSHPADVVRASAGDMARNLVQLIAAINAQGVQVPLELSTELSAVADKADASAAKSFLFAQPGPVAESGPAAAAVAAVGPALAVIGTAAGQLTAVACPADAAPVPVGEPLTLAGATAAVASLAADPSKGVVYAGTTDGLVYAVPVGEAGLGAPRLIVALDAPVVGLALADSRLSVLLSTTQIIFIDTDSRDIMGEVRATAPGARPVLTLAMAPHAKHVAVGAATGITFHDVEAA